MMMMMMMMMLLLLLFLKTYIHKDRLLTTTVKIEQQSTVTKMTKT
ncbi:hypothetical protein HT594_00006 [Phenacoccus solenopsis nudivirus]|nr:hypothetical protein HT594_00006 [Phenacoccus solenopsis nudivirus]